MLVYTTGHTGSSFNLAEKARTRKPQQGPAPEGWWKAQSESGMGGMRER